MVFIVSAYSEESDSECDLDMTQEENAAIEFEISGVLDEESNDDDIGKQPSKEPVVVSVSTQTRTQWCRLKKKDQCPQLYQPYHVWLVLLEKINSVAGKTTRNIQMK